MLQRIALRKLKSLEESRSTEPTPHLIDYCESLLPDWERFDYFAPYAAELMRAVGGKLRICFAAPPQHGKTEFTLRGLLWIARYFPGYRHAYVTYNQEQTKDVAANFRLVAREAGFNVSGTLGRVVLRWGNGKRTIIRFTSVGGSLTGKPIDGLCIIDDAIKDREASRSPATRRRVVEWWKSVARTRRHPATSYIVMATRWPGGDLTDHLIKKEGWRYINLKAIAEPEGPEDLAEDGTVLSDPLGRKQGESLSKRKPPDFFEEDRRDIFWWASMFQGSPQPEGAQRFATLGSQDANGRQIGPGLYSELPKAGYRFGFGVDLAYTASTSADWSICIEGLVANGYLYIIDVVRRQVDAPSFANELIKKKANRPGAIFRFYAGGTERGSADFIRRKLGRVFRVIPATTDKFVRSTPASASWNAGRILLPDPAVFDVPWMDDFLAVVNSFTGAPGEQDDDVDALAALHDQLLHQNPMLSALNKLGGKPN